MQTKISKLKDGQEFYLSPRKKTKYRLDTKQWRQGVLITSLESNRTYNKPGNTVCYTVV